MLASYPPIGARPTGQALLPFRNILSPLFPRLVTHTCIRQLQPTMYRGTCHSVQHELVAAETRDKCSTLTFDMAVLHMSSTTYREVCWAAALLVQQHMASSGSLASQLAYSQRACGHAAPKKGIHVCSPSGEGEVGRARCSPATKGTWCCITLLSSWLLCHRFSVYNATDVTVDRAHSSFVSIATWLSVCLAAKELQFRIDTPEQLVDDEALGVLETASRWLSYLMR